MAMEGTSGEQMTTTIGVRLFRNVVLGAVVLPPLWLALLWLWARITMGPSNADYEWNAFLLNSLTLVPQVAVGTLLQQCLLLLARDRMSLSIMRLVAILAEVAAVVTIAIVASGELYPVISPDALVSLAIAASLVVLAMKLPAHRRSGSAPD